ncbi:alpha/beta fold hydrolase [Paenibacillus sp. FSL R5-0810]|uniref:alpha/beta fold hydrolase n=1 Tax=Paenibacillus sp. FSL R5-0810 TaxID=2921659 RepID=UPI0030F4C4F4
MPTTENGGYPDRVERGLIAVRGTRLYVELSGGSKDAALLYLHGGPGASCVDFCWHQAGVLSSHMTVVALDQRGVLRSDPISEDERFGLGDIIKDCEALRVKLGIAKWTLLGHSFGAIVAFRYAVHYPQSVNKVIFEGPCFDASASMRSLIAKAQGMYRALDHVEEADLCRSYLACSHTSLKLWQAWGRIGQGLGAKRDNIYFHGMDPDDYNSKMDRHITDASMWAKNRVHAAKLEAEGKFLDSLIPELFKLSQPSLLIAGRFDPVCCETQQQAYMETVKGGRMVVLEGSGHFPRLEEPERYAQEVIQFVLGSDA